MAVSSSGPSRVGSARRRSKSLTLRSEGCLAAGAEDDVAAAGRDFGGAGGLADGGAELVA